MNADQQKIISVLSSLVPEGDRNAVNEAVEALVNSLEESYNKELDKAYKDLTSKEKELESFCENEFGVAYDIIVDQRHRMNKMQEEFNNHLEESFGQAYNMLEKEKGKNNNLSQDLYEEYDNKLNEVKEYIVDKVDQFLALKGDEFVNEAKNFTLNDPAIAEHKVALDKILEVASHYIDADNYHCGTSNKVEELNRKIEESKGQMRILEARNMRLHTDNTKLNEVARQAQEVLNEGAKIERNVRKNTARNVQGKGQRVLDDVKIISEHTEVAGEPVADDSTHTRNQLFNEWRSLAGLGEQN